MLMEYGAVKEVSCYQVFTSDPLYHPHSKITKLVKENAVRYFPSDWRELEVLGGYETRLFKKEH